MVLLGGAARAADFALGGAGGPASGNVRTDPTGVVVQGKTSGSLLLNAGFDFLHRKPLALGIELPVGIHGSTRSDIDARGGFTSLYTERVAVVFTPGIRARFIPERRISPWVSFGAGLARIHREGLGYGLSGPNIAQIDSNLTPALAPAAGVDIRFTRRWFLRGEFRDYIYRTPATGFVASFAYWNRWNYNPVIGASLGFRL